MDAAEENDHEIVIVGGGICGLATALALHRKGIKSVVLEKSETLRATGAGIRIMANGWRALDQLGISSKLRRTALPIHGVRDIWLDKGKQRESPLGIGEARCLKRSDLIDALRDALQPGTIHFGRQIVSVTCNPQTTYPILQLRDGSSIVAKVLIGCDGAKSIVADFLELKPTKLFGIRQARGLTNYSNGHAFAHEFVRMRRDNILIGRIPVNDKLVYWFVCQQCIQADAKFLKDPKLIIQSTLESIIGFPTEIIEMIRGTELDSLSFKKLRYHAPWDLLLGKFRKGTVTVAGDAMHVMGPFLGQGGSAGLEDAIVLARSLAQKMGAIDPLRSDQRGTMVVHEVGEALDQYVKERRMRVVQLSTQAYLTGAVGFETSSLLVKFICIVIMAILFTNPLSHTNYDCGCL